MRILVRQGVGGRCSNLRRPLVAAAVAAASLLLPALIAPAGAGEFRVILDGQAAVVRDGNYGQRSLFGDAGDPETVGRAGFDLRLSYDWQRAGLALVYSPSYEQILEGGDEERREQDAVAHRLLLGFQGELTRRLSLSVQERLFQTPNLDLYLPPTSPDTVAVARRGDQLAHNLDLGFRYAVTRRASLTLGASHGLRTFDDTDLFDTETQGVNLGGAWQLSEFQSLGASAGLGRFEYEDGREDDVRLLGVNYTFGFGRDTQVTLDAGTFSVDSTFLELLVPESPETPPLPPGEEPPLTPVTVLREEEETGWRGGIGISQRRELFSWNLGYRHDLSAGYGLGRAAEADNAYAGISTALGRNVTVGLDGNISRQRELGDRADRVIAGGATGDDRPLSEFAAGTLRLGWTVLPSLRLNAGYSRIWQEARVEPFEDLSYSRYFLGLAFRIFSRGETPKDPLRPEEREEEGPTGERTDSSGDDENDEPDAQ
ncbi:MAG TPA: hypothetical protein VHN15_08815 [Thermoanaerobaculia bacterium]|nr:hypothetical protein [Thermoanaerobaculia bacterium]